MSLQAGDTLPPFRIASISAEGMKVWAKVLHDPNPIHLDPSVVRARGLGDKVINQGPANLAYIINMLQAAFPRATISSLQTRFVDNVFAEDDVSASGTVTSIDANQAICEVWLRAAARDLVITGTAVLKLK